MNTENIEKHVNHNEYLCTILKQYIYFTIQRSDYFIRVFR